jgi:ubiquinone/menaquinone biosynthesis C-methylase UbiE
MERTSGLTREHLEKIRAHYDRTPPESKSGALGYRAMIAHYFNLLIPPQASVLEIGCGAGELLARIKARRKVGVDVSAAQVAAARERMPDAEFHVQAGEALTLNERFDFIVISDTLNLIADVQQVFAQLHHVSHPETRLLLNFHSNLWRPFLRLGKMLGLKSEEPQNSWLSTTDVQNLLQLADWQVIQVQPRILCPLRCFGLERFINRWIAPLFDWMCLTVFCIARPFRPSPTKPCSVSVIIPARNEAGNIAAAVERVATMGSGTELIFVEGHSRDHTWAEIQRVAKENPDKKIKIMQQAGKGKGDAVRQGFAAATGDILMILDADLTMPPEELPKFYEVIASGHADFANGVRLVYPMDEKAMQFLNLCANKTFGILFTWLLGQPVKDTLCGTKVLTRRRYEEIAANRQYFGDFDPFGDFDLLFGAAKLNMKIADVPIRYRERTYGTTNIHRWSHGWLLLRMVGFAARKLKFV